MITINFESSLDSLEDSRSIYRSLKEDFYESWVLDLISLVYSAFGRMDKRCGIARKRFEMARKRGDRWTMADAVGQMGFIAEMKGRYEEAEAKFNKAIPVFREFGDLYHTCEYIFHLGQVVLLSGDICRAKTLLAEGQALVRQHNIIGGIGYEGLLLEGMIFIAEEKYEQALHLFEEASSYGVPPGTFISPLGMALAMCGTGDYSTALIQFPSAVETASYYKAVGWLVQSLPTAALIAASESQLERATELLAFAAHHPASTAGWLDVCPLITRLRTRLEAELPSQVFTEAWERGLKLDLNETIATLLPEDINPFSGSDQSLCQDQDNDNHPISDVTME